MNTEHKNYAYLPEDLLSQMLEQAPQTAEQLAETIKINDEEVDKARSIMEK